MPSMDETQRLIDALRAMPNAPFGHLLLPEARTLRQGRCWVHSFDLRLIYVSL